LDAQRGYQADVGSRARSGSSRSESRFQPRRRSRPEPRFARNDPERPIGYDPERWAGFEPEDLAGPGGGDVSGEGDDLFGGTDLLGDQDSGRGTDPNPAARKGSGRRPDRQFGDRTGLNSKRRSDRLKKPRPERTPEERAQRTAKRRERAAAEVAADPTAAAKSVVLAQLTMGPRTRAQLRAAMDRKAIPEDVATAVLDRFQEVNLIDDEEFARQWVQSRHLGRGLAPRALAYELRQRGVADETVKEAVDELTPDDELLAARELVRRKAASMRNDDPQRRIRRLAGMLARKGYGGGIAMQAIREELADLADQADEAGLEFSDDD
jgi:regulatory protein